MQELNLLGLNCPLPVLKTKKFLANLPSGSQVRVISNDPASAQDLADFCQKSGNNLIKQSTTEDQTIITIIQRR